MSRVDPSGTSDAGGPAVETAHGEEFLAPLRRTVRTVPDRINVDAQSLEQGLGKLVLTLIEFIRRLLEQQALRRMDGGSLSAEQIEELGLALMMLESKMGELKAQFGLSDDDLNYDLGPLGKLI